MSAQAPPKRARAFGVAIVLSLGVHAAIWAGFARERPRPPIVETIELEMIEAPPPPPPPPEPIVDPVEEEVAQVTPPPKPKPRPKVELPPPPPNAPPPAPEPAAKPPPIRIGISLGSTTTGGGFAVGAGNTLYGKADERAADPSDVRGYAAPTATKAPYIPPSRVSSLPKCDPLDVPSAAYPEEARRAGIEGQAVLQIRVDDAGKVVTAKLIEGPGYGIDELALQRIRQLRCKPALLEGQAVSTDLRYTITFLLE